VAALRLIDASRAAVGRRVNIASSCTTGQAKANPMVELLRDTVYRAIRSAILTCELLPGQELREQVLAEKYRVSRSPVRDSLLRLEQENLVTVLPRQGYRVNAISLRDVQELFGMRLIISPACAAQAARAGDRAVHSLDRFRGVVGDQLTHMAFLEYNRAFHAAVALLAGNSRLAAVENGLVDELDRLVLLGLQVNSDQWVPRSVIEHEKIIDAIQAHDSDTAFQLVHAHVLDGHMWREAASPKI
jgi:GntR family transcriptional regulator, rspAB operon transcriptional repressor